MLPLQSFRLEEELARAFLKEMELNHHGLRFLDFGGEVARLAGKKQGRHITICRTNQADFLRFAIVELDDGVAAIIAAGKLAFGDGEIDVVAVCCAFPELHPQR